MSRALVLGSGGQTALGWEVGVLEGLAAGGVRVDGWDFIVGSSAGSIVGSWVAAGRLHEVHQQLATADPAVDRDAMAAGMGNRLPYLLAVSGLVGRVAVGVWTLGVIVRRLVGAARLRGVRSLPRVTAVFARYLGPDGLTVEELTALAPVSVGQRQRQLPAWEAYWAARLQPVSAWPAPRLGIVAFCPDSSERQVFESGDRVPLARAIAASFAVPGIVGAVGIGGRNFVDYFPHDSTSADLAAGFDDVLVLAPDTNPGELARSLPPLESAGVRVRVVEPSDRASFGERIEHLDAMRLPAALALGFRDGQAAAKQLQGL